MRLGPPASKSRLRVRLAPFDILWAIVAPLIALALRDQTLLETDDFPSTIRPAYVYALVTACCALPSFALFRVSEGMSRFFSVRDVVSVCVAACVAVASSSVLLFVLTRLEGVPRSTPLICALVMIAGLLLARMVERLIHDENWTVAKSPEPEPHDEIRRRVILVGVDRFAAIAIKLIDSQRPRSTLVVATLDPRPDFLGRKVGGVRIVGDVSSFSAVIEEYAIHGVEVDEVWVSDGAPLSSQARSRLKEDCALRGLPLMALSEALNLSPAPQPRLTIQHTISSDVNDYLRLKRALDVITAGVLLVLLAPVALIVACLTLLDLGTPVLFWQQRIGMGGRKFLLYKFRTYQAPFDTNGARVSNGEHISLIGRFLRATRLDELPQLINVLVGDMSIVGPRPLLPQDQPADPSTRLMVRPGITGWAQINGGRSVCAEEKDALDVWYVRHSSFALDLRIVLSTGKFLLTGEKLNAPAIREALTFRTISRREGRGRQTGALTHAPIHSVVPLKKIMR